MVDALTLRKARLQAGALLLSAGFALAMAIAALTRLGWLGLVEFKNDESWAMRMAVAIARGQDLPLVGIGSSLGIPNAPFFVYLMALPALLDRNPTVATGFIAVLGVLAVGIAHGIAARVADRVAAVAAALFYAVSPWGIIFSRKIWAQDALPAFVGLCFWALLASVLTGRRILIAPAVILLTLSTQLHPTAFFLVPPALVLIGGCLVLDRTHPGATLRWLAVGLIGALLIELPFLIWQMENGWPLAAIVRRLGEGPARVDGLAFSLAGSVAVGNGYPTLAQVPNSWRPAGIIEAALLVIGSTVLIARIRQKGALSQRICAAALLLWLATPVLGQVRHAVPLYPHYFIVLYPAPFVVAGMGVSTLYQWVAEHARGSILGPWIAAAVTGLPVLIGMLAFAAYIDALARGAVQAAFGAPLASQLTLLETADRLAAGGSVYLGTHDDLAPSLVFLSGGRWRAFDDRRGLCLPAAPRPAILAITDPHTTAGQLANRWLSDDYLTDVPLDSLTQAALFRIRPGVVESAADFHSLEVAFEDGMILSGYRLAIDQANRRLLVDLHWRLGPNPSAKPPTVFNHLVDARGVNAAGADGLAYDGPVWNAGDTCIDEFAIPWPVQPGMYRLEVGLYDYPSMRRFRIVRPIPGAPSDSLDLGTVVLPPSER
jgi:hypothetical protein